MSALAAFFKRRLALLLLAATVWPSAASSSFCEPASEVMFEECLPGLLARKRLDFNQQGRFVYIIDLVVGPGKTSSGLQLPKGGGLLAVEGGEASLSIDGKIQLIKPSNMLPLTEGQTITIDNGQGLRPLVARLTVLAGN